MVAEALSQAGDGGRERVIFVVGGERVDDDDDIS